MSHRDSYSFTLEVERNTVSLIVPVIVEAIVIAALLLLLLVAGFAVLYKAKQQKRKLKLAEVSLLLVRCLQNFNAIVSFRLLYQ